MIEIPQRISLDLTYIVNASLTLNYDNRQQNIHVKDMIIKPAWLQQFCTVQINCGRRTGKTEYIESKVNDKNTLIITYNDASKRKYEEKLKGNISNIFVHFPMNIKDRRIIDFNKIDLNNVYYVYVDEPRLTFENKYILFDFYNLFSQCKSEPTFIMLGE